MKLIFLMTGLVLFSSAQVWAAETGSTVQGPVKIGNSDDGRDLEDLRPVTGGPIKEAQAAALKLVDALNVPGIRGLGSLRPELEKAELLLAKEDVPASIQDDYRPDHLSSGGKVFARTLPEPYAPTRFFPVAESLTQAQLVKLHIHEALHRALPEDLRTDERIVAQITLALTSPGASHDQVRAVVSRLVPLEEDKISFRKDLFPSHVGYGLRQIVGANKGDYFDLTRMHVLKSHLYPFGSDTNTFGLGLDFSLIERNGALTSGPLGISFRWKALTARNFDFDFYGSASLNTLSFQELKNSPYGRDVYELGVSLRRELGNFYIENSISLRNGGSASQNLGFVQYTYTFGNVIQPQVHLGWVWGNFHVGSYLDFFLSDEFAVSGGSFAENKGRFRVVALGPEASYRFDNLLLSTTARFLVDSTKDADLSNLGLLDAWVGNGGIEFSVGYRF